MSGTILSGRFAWFQEINNCLYNNLFVPVVNLLTKYVDGLIQEALQICFHIEASISCFFSWHSPSNSTLSDDSQVFIRRDC